MSHVDTHRAAIATLTDATTAEQFAAAFTMFAKLDKPGFPNDLADGQYFDGFFFATMTGGNLAVTPMRDLPDRTTDLWARHEEGKRRDSELIAEGLAGGDRRGRGRPAIGPMIPVRILPWRLKVLDDDAKAVDVERAVLIRALIEASYRTLHAEAEATGTDRTELIRALVTNRVDASPAS
jgi:hypothetical protein